MGVVLVLALLVFLLFLVSLSGPPDLGTGAR